jgi:hypothetical protein
MSGFREQTTNYPHFIVRMPSNGSLVSGGAAIIAFGNATSGDTSTVDTGSNFNNSRFTAPFKGLYHFDVAMGILNNSSASDDSMEFGFSKNYGTGGVVLWPIGSNWGGNTTSGVEISVAFSISVPLNQNDTISTFYQNKQDSEWILHNSYFSGYLVKEFL